MPDRTIVVVQRTDGLPPRYHPLVALAQGRGGWLLSYLDEMPPELRDAALRSVKQAVETELQRAVLDYKRRKKRAADARHQMSFLTPEERRAQTANARSAAAEARADPHREAERRARISLTKKQKAREGREKSRNEK